MAISHAAHNHPTTPAGRAACRDAANIALADAVDAVRACGTVTGGSPEFVALANVHEAACTVHANLTNTTIEATMLKVGLIVSMLPRR